MNQTNNRIREEFEQKFTEFANHKDLEYGLSFKDLNVEQGDEMKVIVDIENFWLSKIDELLKSQREELVEKIGKAPIWLFTSKQCQEDILSLIKEDN